MFNMFNPILLIAEDQQGIFETAPAVAPTVEATPEPGAGLVGQILNVLTTPTQDNDIPKALNTLWKMAMEGNMYKTVSLLGMLIAVFGVGFWCVKFYRTIEEGGLRPAINDVVAPIILVIMLSNSGDNMRSLTLGARDAMNSFNVNLNQIIDVDVNLGSALNVLKLSDVSLTVIDGLTSDCKSKTQFTEYKDCMNSRGVWAKAIVQGIDGSWPSTNDKSNFGAQWQKEIDEWKTYTANYANNRFNIDDLNAARDGFAPGNAKGLDIKNIKSFKDTAELRGIILSFRGSFLYIIEVMMLVTALVGPIFLALCMFPVGVKPLLGWGTSFLTLGFCKICFSLISGLSSMAMVLSGPNNIDMLVASIVLGLLAPVLAFSIASGTGISALSTISYSAQPFKIGTGITPYTPQAIDNGQRNPTETRNK
jgi:hypothetical protein